ncbi:MAG: class I SAM-dependent methyltransferase [Verrucomicrobiota bacterium]
MTAAERIANAFACGRWLRGYVKGKLNADPVFNKGMAAIEGKSGLIIDLGCGLGLFALWLREHGCKQAVLGCDLGQWKVAAGMLAAKQLGLSGIELRHQDMTRTPLDNASAVCAFDVLHYLPAKEQESLVRSLAAAARGGALVLIRTGVRGLGWRSAITSIEERWTRITGWIRGGEANFPVLKDLIAAFETEGCSVKAEPLWGKTPFSSHWFEVEAAPVCENGPSDATDTISALRKQP